MTGIIRYKKNNSEMLPVIILLGVTLVAEIISYFMAKVYRNNMPGYHFFNPLQLIIWGFFFYATIEDEKIKKSIPWTLGIVLLFSIINTLFFQPLKTMPDNFMKVATLVNIIWAGLLFMQQLDVPARENIFKNPLFIIALAVMWFNIISSFYFILYGFMVKYKLSSHYVHQIHYFSNLVYYLLFFVAMLLLKPSPNHVRKI